MSGAARGQETGQDTGAITGHVVDAQTGAGLGKVLVQVEDGGPSTRTDDSGAFALPRVEAGPRRLYVSVVGYILVRRDVQVSGTGSLTVTIPLSEGTGTYTEIGHRRGGSFPSCRAGRCRAADARQRRHPEPAGRAGRRSAARRAGAAGRRDGGRSAQRVQRPRQPFQPHEHDSRRLLDAVFAAHGAGGRRPLRVGLGRDDQQRYSRGRDVAERRLRAALRRSHRRGGRFPAAGRIPRAPAGARGRQRHQRVARRSKGRSAARAAGRG